MQTKITYAENLNIFADHAGACLAKYLNFMHCVILFCIIGTKRQLLYIFCYGYMISLLWLYNASALNRLYSGSAWSPIQ